VTTYVVYRHNDLPRKMYTQANNTLANVNLYNDTRLQWGPNSHTDIPRLRQGRVGAQVSLNTVTQTPDRSVDG
jgi:hypothetical protein